MHHRDRRFLEVGTPGELCLRPLLLTLFFSPLVREGWLLLRPRGHMQLQRQQHAGPTKAGGGCEHAPGEGSDAETKKIGTPKKLRSKRHEVEAHLAHGLTSIVATGTAGSVSRGSQGARMDG